MGPKWERASLKVSVTDRTAKSWLYKVTSRKVIFDSRYRWTINVKLWSCALIGPNILDFFWISVENPTSVGNLVNSARQAAQQPRVTSSSNLRKRPLPRTHAKVKFFCKQHCSLELSQGKNLAAHSVSFIGNSCLFCTILTCFFLQWNYIMIKVTFVLSSGIQVNLDLRNPIFPLREFFDLRKIDVVNLKPVTRKKMSSSWYFSYIEIHLYWHPFLPEISK